MTEQKRKEVVFNQELPQIEWGVKKYSGEIVADSTYIKVSRKTLAEAKEVFDKIKNG